MSEFKGTPGKWGFNGKEVRSPKPELTIAYCSTGARAGKDGNRVIANSEADANARLIAAAPDLLEALDWAIAEIEGRTRYDPNDVYEAEDQRENALNCARNAIAKALQS